MSVFCFYRHLSLKARGHVFRFRFSLEDKRGLSLGSWYVHFASCFITVIYNVFIHNNAFWSNSNAFSLIICKVRTKRENSGSWKYGPGKATLGYKFCTTPNKLKLYREFLWNIWRILEQISTRGCPPGGHNPPECAREPRRALVSCAHPGPSPVPIF